MSATEPTPSGDATETEARPPRPRFPLIIGGIACGGIVWMFVVVMLLIAWKMLG